MFDNLKESVPLFYYHDGLKQCGPFTKKELQDKEINSDTLIWKEGAAYWQKAEFIKELRELLEKNSLSDTGIKKPTNNTPPPFSPKYIKEVRIAILPRRSQVLMLVSAALGLLLIAGIFAAKLRKDEANYKEMDIFQIDGQQEESENAVSEKEAQIAVEKMLEEFERNGRKKELKGNEKKKKNENTENKNEFEYKKKLIRNNFKGWIGVQENKYTHKEIGGIYDLSITISNTSPFLIDEVVVSVNYIKTNGNTYKTEKLYFENIKPGTSVSQKAPNSDRGKTVSHSIASVICEGLNLCYREGKENKDSSDPYYCK